MVHSCRSESLLDTFRNGGDWTALKQDDFTDIDLVLNSFRQATKLLDANIDVTVTWCYLPFLDMIIHDSWFISGSFFGPTDWPVLAVNQDFVARKVYRIIADRWGGRDPQRLKEMCYPCPWGLYDFCHTRFQQWIIFKLIILYFFIVCFFPVDYGGYDVGLVI